MEEEERKIEINIIMDKPLVIALLIIIIVLEAGYIGYLHFSPTRESGKSSAISEEQDTIDDVKETGEPSFDFDEPNTFDELKSDLIAIGCEHVIEDWNHWQGKQLKANYTEALKMAKNAAFVGLNEEIEAFIIFLDGNFYIWFMG